MAVLLLLAAVALLAPRAATAADSAVSAGWECTDNLLVSPDDEAGLAMERCCTARRMWQEIQATGGCGGPNSMNSELDCSSAEALCRDCVQMQTHLAANATASEGAAGSSTGAEGDALSTMDPRALEMRCALTTAEATTNSLCTDTVTDAGLAIVFVAGLLLLMVSMVCTSLFDKFSLPSLSARLSRPLEAVPPSIGKASFFDGPMGPSTPVGAPMQMPQFPAEASAAASQQCALRMAASAGGLPVMAPSPALPALAVLMQAAAQGRPDSITSPKWGAQPGLWPPRLAAVWGFRRAFLSVAAFALVARLATIAACAALTLRRGAAGLILEPLACLAPMLWCWWFSRPPADTTGGIPQQAAYGWPCSRVPRFTAFALSTVVLELYSTADAATEVAYAPCYLQPWRLVLPYCIGILVAVLRAYSALLALRLQDDFAGACRRVLPVSQEELDAAVAAPVRSCDVECRIGDDAMVGEASCATPTSPKPPTPSQRRSGSSLKIAVTPRRAPAALDELENGESSPKPHSPGPSPCASRCRKQCGRRCLMRVSIVAVLLSATTAALLARALRRDKAPEELPSSCATAQNATATCVDFELVGGSLWDHAIGDSVMETADTMEDCCRGCDEVDGCQGWMFERFARRCRWIRFRAEPCSSNPGDLSCRCLTHFGTAFGFRPTSQIIWVQRGV